MVCRANRRHQMAKVTESTSLARLGRTIPPSSLPYSFIIRPYPKAKTPLVQQTRHSRPAGKGRPGINGGGLGRVGFYLFKYCLSIFLSAFKNGAVKMLSKHVTSKISTYFLYYEPGNSFDSPRPGQSLESTACNECRAGYVESWGRTRPTGRLSVGWV